MSIATQCGRLRKVEFLEDKCVITFDTVLAKKIMDAYVETVGVESLEPNEESVHTDHMLEEPDDREADKPSDSLQPSSPDLVVIPFCFKEKISYDELYAGFECVWKEQNSPKPSDVYVKIKGHGMLFIFATPEECKKFRSCYSKNHDQLEEKGLRIALGQKVKDFNKIGQNYHRWRE